VLIPRVFHQIWLGPDPFPDEYAAYQQTWIRHHPGWELRFWTEDNLPGDLRRPEATEPLRAPAERADILRLELVWRFGGVYVDTDIECLRAIEPLIENADLFIGLAKPGRVNNALLGAVANHPLLDRALAELSPRASYGYDKEAAGPKFLDRLLLEDPQVTLVEPELFYPQTPEERSNAYADHRMARSWKDPELLRSDLERAERKMQAAQQTARKWRARYEQAETELTRLRRAWPIRLLRFGRRLSRRPRSGS
jgi:mannosyltransferase OCH1-like enzyme